MTDIQIDIKESVKKYYGETLQKSEDLQTNACKIDSSMPDYVKAALSNVHTEVSSRFYGCGLVMPELISGTQILDLGCGSGQDVYVLAQLVGKDGFVVGVDMTDEQLAVAQQYQHHHQQVFGYNKPNTQFFKGDLEKLDKISGLNKTSFDIIVSNCVINLCQDKAAVLKHAYDLLVEGGELYFSDVYSDRRVPQSLIDDPVLYGECISGALYWNDFLSLAKSAGFADPRLVSSRRLTIDKAEIEQKLGEHKFYSATYRLFKITDLDSSHENYGQAVSYRGSVAHHPDSFELDQQRVFSKGKTEPVCRNTYKMLHDSRFKPHFDFIGDQSTHVGIFPGYGEMMPFSEGDDTPPNSGCC